MLWDNIVIQMESLTLGQCFVDEGDNERMLSGRTTRQDIKRLTSYCYFYYAYNCQLRVRFNEVFN